LTIALAIKVNDGLVLTTDSATTITSAVHVPGQDLTLNVFNNEQKITHLHDFLPIGFMTWGLGVIQDHSINWHAKEIRNRFMGVDQENLEWKIDADNYELNEVAVRVYEYFQNIFPVVDPNVSIAFGVLVGGYSANGGEPEVYTCVTSNTSELKPPELTMPKKSVGSIWFGQPEAIFRLVRGASLKLPEALKKLGVDESLIHPYAEAILRETGTNLVWSGMPIQDAIDLAVFFANTSINFSRFNAGANTVAGPIDVAAITRHEGLKWVSRKHYYPIELNPKGSVK